MNAARSTFLVLAAFAAGSVAPVAWNARGGDAATAVARVPSAASVQEAPPLPPSPAAVPSALPAPPPQRVVVEVRHVAEPLPSIPEHPAAQAVPAAWEPVPGRDAGTAGLPAPAPARLENAPSADEGTSRTEQIELPSGTSLMAVLETPVSSRTARPGDLVAARVVSDVTLGGRTVVPAGSRLSGVVREARQAGRVKGNGHLALTFDKLTLPDGWRTSVSAAYEETARGKTARDAAVIGGSAAGGALLGRILGKDSGSTVGGAVLGGAIGTGVVLSTRGRELELEAGHRLVLETRSPLLLPAAPAAS